MKTAGATADDPFNKWQTYVYIDDQRVDPALVQASDTGGDQFFVNKYGEIKTSSELQALQRTSADSAQYLITTGTVYKKYSYDQLSRRIVAASDNCVSVARDSKYYRQSESNQQQRWCELCCEIDTRTIEGDRRDFSEADLTTRLELLFRDKLTNMFKISIDGSEPVKYGLEHLAGRNSKLSGQQIAFELTNI